MLIYAGATARIPALALAALVIFIIVALVGAALNLRYHVHMEPLPKNTIVIHGIAAVIAFVLLLLTLHQ